MQPTIQYNPQDSVIPIFRRAKPTEQLVQIATATFVEIGYEPFLLTAAHVADESFDGELYVPTEVGFKLIDGYLALIDLPPEQNRSEDEVDVAYYRLSTEFANLLCTTVPVLKSARLKTLQTAYEHNAYSAVGYPVTKSKKKDGVYSSEIYCPRGIVANSSVYDSLNLSTETSIVIHFNRKNAVDASDYKPSNPPGLRGLSGGPIFAWPRNDERSTNWSLPLMVGIMHSYREKDGLIIGTTLMPVLAAVELGRMKNFDGVV
jgi:hypothetical protein